MIFAGKEIPPGTGHTEGRRLLTTLYRQHWNTAMPPILVTYRGKPYFNQGPYFSITHTHHHVFCALSDRSVGIDAEELDRDIDLRLADKILSPGELEQYRNSQDPRVALLTFWVLKEAQAKCSGEGLRGYPKNTDFSLADPRVTVQQGCLVAIIEEEL